MTPSIASMKKAKEEGKNNSGGREGGKSPIVLRLVYVSRDFFATMDSQLSVFCDDALELLNDTDKYWWLVREPKSGQTGYIPSDIVETADEYEAKVNGRKNIELTRAREQEQIQLAEPAWRNRLSTTDSGINITTTSIANEANYNGGGSESSWSLSGFVRKNLNSKPSGMVDGLADETNGSSGGGSGGGGGETRGHKKTVSFSETKPTEHTFEVEESSGTSSSDVEFGIELAGLAGTGGLSLPPAPNQVDETGMIKEEKLELKSPSYYDQNLDPLVEELLKREFGSPIVKDPHLSTPGMTLQSSIIPNQHRSSSKAQITTKHATRSMGDTIAKPKKLKNLIAKFWKGKEEEWTRPDEQLLRIYAGNFTLVQGYKTLLVEESTFMADVADKACEKFGLTDDGFDYILTVVHYETHEILQVSANYQLGTVIELAKRATLLENSSNTESKKSLVSKKLSKSQSKKQKAGMNSGVSSGGMSLLLSPLQQLTLEDIKRDKKSDFVTHYKFVLNRWLEGPAPTMPFYIQVQVISSSALIKLLSGVVSKSTADTPRNLQSPLKQQQPSLPSLANEERVSSPVAGESSVIKMLVNTSMSTAELLRAALFSLGINNNVPGVKYELSLTVGTGSSRDRIFLTRELTVQDVLHLKPMVDPSGLTLLLQPATDKKHAEID